MKESSTTKKLSEKEREELRAREKMEKRRDGERQRRVIEKYKTGRIGTTHVVSFSVVVLVFFVYLVYAFLVEDFSAPVFWSLISIITIGSIATTLDDDWKNVLIAKRDVARERGEYIYDDWDVTIEQDKTELLEKAEAIYPKFSDYEQDSFYTDSIVKYYGYLFSKISFWALSAILVLLAIILGFMWLGSISIAPTTIIIILLIVIILNQGRGR